MQNILFEMKKVHKHHCVCAYLKPFEIEYVTFCAFCFQILFILEYNFVNLQPVF